MDREKFSQFLDRWEQPDGNPPWLAGVIRAFEEIKNNLGPSVKQALEAIEKILGQKKNQEEEEELPTIHGKPPDLQTPEEREVLERMLQELLWPAVIPWDTKTPLSSVHPARGTTEVQTTPLCLKGGGRVVYKRVFTGLEKKAAGLPAEGFFGVLETAKRRLQEYLAAIYAFGEEGVAKTLVMITNPLGRVPQREPQGEVSTGIMALEKYVVVGELQEKVTPLNEAIHLTNKARKNPELLRALRRFYGRYVEGVLMGYLPDLQIWVRESQEGPIFCEGDLIFNRNAGLVIRREKMEAVFFDFGFPRQCLFSLEIMKRLREVINAAKKERNELPIVRNIILEPQNDKTVVRVAIDLAPWYEEELRNQLNNLQQKGFASEIISNPTIEPPFQPKEFIDQLKRIFTRKFPESSLKLPKDFREQPARILNEVGKEIRDSGMSPKGTPQMEPVSPERKPTQPEGEEELGILVIGPAKLKYSLENIIYQTERTPRMIDGSPYYTTIVYIKEGEEIREIYRETPEDYL